MARSPSSRGVLVAAAEPLLRDGILAALVPPYVPAAVEGTLTGARRALAQVRPPLAVLVLDPPLSGGTLEASCVQLIAQHARTAPLVLLRHPQRTAVRLACRCGARGVWPLDLTPEQLRQALRRVDAGDIVVPLALLPYALAADAAGGDGALVPPRLTPRELAALRLVAGGDTYKQVAQVLETTPKAVEHTLRRAARRLGAHHRTQAVALALRRGLLA